MKQSNKWLTLITTSTGTLMSALNASIVNIANPVLVTEFGVTMAQVQWVSTIYLIVTSSLMLFFGRLGDRVGSHKVYIAGIITFTIGSITCALVDSLELLMVARAIQGLGAAMVVSTSTGLVVTIFPLEQRGSALGITVLMVGLGNVAGPVVGGLILAYASWHYIFLISAPFGIAAAIMAILWLRSPLPKKPEASLDAPGSILFTAVIICLIVFLTGGFRGQEWFGLGVIGFGIAFYLVERREKDPLLDIQLLKNKRFAMGNLITFFSYSAYMIMIFQMPFFLDTVWGIPIGTVGLLMMINALFLAISGPLSGFASDRFGTFKIMLPALIAYMICMIAALLLGKEVAIWHFVIVMVLSGAGMGFLNTPNNSDIMTSAGRKKSSYASGFVATNRNLGFCIGTAVSASVFALGNRVATDYPALLGIAEGDVIAEHLFAFKMALAVCLLLVIASLVICWRLMIFCKTEDQDTESQPDNSKKPE